MKPAFACAVLSVLSCAALAQTAKHPFNIDDWTTLRSAHAVALAPDGNTILYSISYGADKGPTHHDWRLIAKDGSHRRDLELPEHFEPAGFMPDGASLYGTWEVNKLPQLAVFALAGLKKTSTPSLIVALPRGVHSALLAPDGAHFALLADPRPPDDLAEVRTIVEPAETSLYVLRIDGTAGQWRCPSLNMISDSPGAGNAEGTGAIAWSRDGASLAVLSATPKIGHHEVRSYLDICTAAGARRVAEIPNQVTGIAWGDDERELVFLSTTTSVITPDHVWSVPVAGGSPSDRTPNIKGSAVDLIGDPHGNVWVVLNTGVQNEIVSFHDRALKAAFRWPDGYISGTPVFPQLASAPESLAFTVGDPSHSNNVAVPQNGQLHKITSEADDQIAHIDLGPMRAVHWTSKEGIALEGIATFPANFSEGRRYPFLVLPHGGPESNDLLSLDPFARIIAGLGYVVLQPEYRGSTGYGSDFLNAIYQHFGDRAYRDVDSATDFAIAQGWADPNRLAVFGWSAGGFMTAWTVTQTSRYKAAIEGAGITDWASFLWTSDVQQIDYDARWPEQDPAAIAQFSAVAFANRVTTPLLILHGAADLRVPTFQGREFYEVLAARGKTVRLVTYPGSRHFPRLWEQRRDVFREISAWLAKYNP